MLTEMERVGSCGASPLSRIHRANELEQAKQNEAWSLSMEGQYHDTVLQSFHNPNHGVMRWWLAGAVWWGPLYRSARWPHSHTQPPRTRTELILSSRLTSYSSWHTSTRQMQRILLKTSHRIVVFLHASFNRTIARASRLICFLNDDTFILLYAAIFRFSVCFCIGSCSLKIIFLICALCCSLGARSR